MYLSLRDDDYGHIYVGDNEETGDDPAYPNMERLYPIASSFDSFMAKLHADDEA